MKLNSVTIQNFMTVRHARIELAGRGLVLIEGKNVGNTAFESNGAGKSVFPDAITYCAYGETARGLKNDEVVNWDVNKDCAVILEVEDDDGMEYEVARYRKHKEYGNNVVIKQNGNDISRSSIQDNNRFIEELLGLSYTAFTNSVIFGQGVVKYFASYTDKEKKEVLEQLLEVTVFERALQHIKDIKKEKEALYKELTIKVQDIDSSIEQEEERIKEYKEMQDEFQNKRESKIEAIAKKVDSKEKALKKLKKDKKKLKLQLKKLKEEMHSYDEERLSEVLRTSKKLNKELSEILGNINVEERQIRKYNNEMKNTLEELDGECPVCLRSVDDGDTEHVVSEYEKLIKERQASIKKLKKEEARVEKALKVNEKEQKKLEEEREKYVVSEELVNSKKKDIRRAEKDIARVEEELDELAEDFEELEQETGYEEVIEKAEGVLSSHRKKRKLLIKDKEDIDTDLNYYRFWEVGFGNKGIKALLFDSVVPFLNDTVGKYIDILTDNTVEIKFSSFKELKTKGKTKEEFDVKITNKQGSKTYKGNSGGEKRRIDLAILLAFQKLVSSRSHKNLGFVIYDEVFENLDAIGTEKVVQLLKEIYGDDSSCFVITHNAKLKPYFPSTLKVKKNNGVSEYLS